MTTRYKFLTLKEGKLKSYSGNMTWKLNEWQKADGAPSLCNNGLHCSLRMFDAFSYVTGEVVAKVEVKGKKEVQKDKQAWQEMRLVDIRLWDKKDSVALAIYAAELVIDLFEKQMPDDKRPRLAIEAAKTWLENPTDKNRAAAWAARAAGAAAYDEIITKVNDWMESRFNDLAKF